MQSKQLALVVVVVVIAFITMENSVEARYLPTRANGDKLDKLREMYREVSNVIKLLENEIEKEEYQADAPPRWHPESKLFYKREASTNH